MPFFTRTGRPKRGHVPRPWLVTRAGRWLLARSNWYAFIKGPGRILGIPWLLSPRRGERDEAILDDRLPSERAPWHGSPDAELTDEKEHEAQGRAANEWHHRD
jgi:hypothetical protein